MELISAPTLLKLFEPFNLSIETNKLSSDMKTAALLTLLFGLANCWNNAYDKTLDFECPKGNLRKVTFVVLNLN